MRSRGIRFLPGLQRCFQIMTYSCGSELATMLELKTPQPDTLCWHEQLLQFGCLCWCCSLCNLRSSGSTTCPNSATWIAVSSINLLSNHKSFGLSFGRSRSFRHRTQTAFLTLCYLGSRTSWYLFGRTAALTWWAASSSPLRFIIIIAWFEDLPPLESSTMIIGSHICWLGSNGSFVGSGSASITLIPPCICLWAFWLGLRSRWWPWKSNLAVVTARIHIVCIVDTYPAPMRYWRAQHDRPTAGSGDGRFGWPWPCFCLDLQSLLGKIGASAVGLGSSQAYSHFAECSLSTILWCHWIWANHEHVRTQNDLWSCVFLAAAPSRAPYSFGLHCSLCCTDLASSFGLLQPCQHSQDLDAFIPWTLVDRRTGGPDCCDLWFPLAMNQWLPELHPCCWLAGRWSLLVLLSPIDNWAFRCSLRSAHHVFQRHLPPAAAASDRWGMSPNLVPYVYLASLRWYLAILLYF